MVFAVTEPLPNLNLLDRFLVMMERQEIPVIICFNKIDLSGGKEIDLPQCPSILEFPARLLTILTELPGVPVVRAVQPRTAGKNSHTKIQFFRLPLFKSQYSVLVDIC